MPLGDLLALGDLLFDGTGAKLGFGHLCFILRRFGVAKKNGCEDRVLANDFLCLDAFHHCLTLNQCLNFP